MTSRNEKNKRGVSGFVKKSARLSALRTKGTVSSSSSTFSRIKKCLRGVASLRSPSSCKRARKYTASFAASDAAMISASQDDSATDGCFLLLHVMAARPYMNTCPDVE
eukprot:995126-Pleurochrysis_carterae.AAC.1